MIYKALVSYKELSETETVCTFYNMITEKSFSRILPVTEKQIILWADCDMRIQVAMPNLTPGERELFLTGYTEEEFDALFGEE